MPKSEIILRHFLFFLRCTNLLLLRYRNKETENNKQKKGMKCMNGRNGGWLGKLIAILCLLVITMVCKPSISDSHSGINETDFFPVKEQSENKKVAYLTFDDGPSNNTIRILDILDEYQIKATFFVMANSTPVAMEGYKEMIERGHTIALHTYNHDYDKIYVSTDVFFENIVQLEKFLWENFSIKTKTLRFPGGSKNVSSKRYGGQRIMSDIIERCHELGYRYFDWNVDSGDGISPNVSVSSIVTNVLKGAKGKENAIILLHDINAMNNTVTALPTIIKGLKEQGFEFDIISDETEEIQFK